MPVSPQLLALMSFHSPNRRNGVTSWSIQMDFRYPFPWKTVSSFVLRQKAKGPPDDMVTLKIERNIFKYRVKMPWYASLVLGKSILWHDVIELDQPAQVLQEDGENINLQRLGSVRDVSCWRACEDNPDVTLYNKRVDFNIRMPLNQTLMMQVAQPLIRWFKTKSLLCRELEVEAIREYLAETDSDDEDLNSLVYIPPSLRLALEERARDVKAYGLYQGEEEPSATEVEAPPAACGHRAATRDPRVDE